MFDCSTKGLKMDSRTLSLIVISVGFAGFVNFVLTNPILDSLESSSELEKIFSDCKHSDYRTYIQCLKREKRHHMGFLNMDPICLESCLPSCIKESHACEDTCRHCVQTKKIRNRIVNITEIETGTDCTAGNCTKAEEQKPIVVNVTNHIHIHNYYNKSVETTTITRPTSCPCYHITWQPCYCRPQYQICQYQQQWPCIPYGGYGGAIGGAIGGGFGGGYGQIGVGMVESVVGQANNCVCPNEASHCDACNPPVG